MGSIVIMALGFLLQQGFLYNNRQALEMYTFRQALQLSQQNQRGVSLSVSRDVFVPSFFSSLNRQRLTAASFVDYNPYILYIPYEEDPEDLPTWQLLQIGDAMIYRGSFIQVPPTKVKIKSDDSNSDEWNWVTSTAAGFSTEGEWAPLERDYRKYFDKISSYNISIQAGETPHYKRTVKNLMIEDRLPYGMGFDTAAKIRKSYLDNDLTGKIKDVEVDESTIPRDIGLLLNEAVWRGKDVTTPHQ
jgi:hypothetical protein